MAEFPALPLWTDSYLADTSHLTDAERGRYDLMLIMLWRMPECRFPNDDAWLARKFGRTVEQVATDLRPLLKEFFQSDGNWLKQKRLTKERARVQAYSQIQSARIKSRWEKEKKPYRGNTAPVIPPYPYPIEDTAKAVSLSPSDFEAFWHACPKRVGKGSARKAYAVAVAKTAPATLLEAMTRYAASRANEDDRYTAHPATWLNAERWTDQITTTGNGNGQGNGKQPTANAKFLAGAAAFIASLDGPSEGEGVGADADAAGQPLLPP